jgi:hypothetical protein
VIWTHNRSASRETGHFQPCFPASRSVNRPVFPSKTGVSVRRDSHPSPLRTLLPTQTYLPQGVWTLRFDSLSSSTVVSHHFWKSATMLNGSGFSVKMLTLSFVVIPLSCSVLPMTTLKRFVITSPQKLNGMDFHSVPALPPLRKFKVCLFY